MTREEFINNTVIFDKWGILPLMDVRKGGRYTHLVKAYGNSSKAVHELYDIFVDDEYNFCCYPCSYPRKGVFE